MHEQQSAATSRVQTRPAIRTILVVDNDAAARQEIARILREAGYRVIPSSQDVLAHRCLEDAATHVDLIVTDLLPPIPDGYHLGISFAWRWATTPVVFTAVGSREENIRRGLLHPQAPYLRKPFPPRELVRTVRQVLDGWTMTPAA
jgi:two-component system, cell cycle sensor histidine kinase and response regulator CckA